MLLDSLLDTVRGTARVISGGPQVNWDCPLNRGLTGRWISPNGLAHGAIYWHDIVACKRLQVQFGAIRWMGTEKCLGQPRSFFGFIDIGFAGLDSTLTSADLITAAEATFGCWVKPVTIGTTTSSVTGGARIIADTNNRLGLYQATISGADRIWAYNFDGSEDRVGVAYSTNQWIHVVQVHSGGTLYLYADGLLVSSTASGDTNNMNGTWQFGVNPFAGYIHDMFVAKRGFSASDVREWYEDSRTGWQNTLVFQPRRTALNISVQLADVPAAALDFLAVSPSTLKQPAVPVGAVDLLGISPGTKKESAVSAAVATFAALSPGQGASVSAAVVDLLGVAPASDKQQAVAAAAFLVSSPGANSLITVAVDAGSILLSGAEPAESKSAAVESGALAFLGVQSDVTKLAGVAAAAIDFIGVASDTLHEADVSVGVLQFVGIAPDSSSVVDVPAGLLALTGVGVRTDHKAAVDSGSFLLSSISPGISKSVSLPATAVDWAGTVVSALRTVTVPTAVVELSAAAPDTAKYSAVPAASIDLTAASVSTDVRAAVPVALCDIQAGTPSVLHSTAVPTSSFTLTAPQTEVQKQADVSYALISFVGLPPAAEYAGQANGLFSTPIFVDPWSDVF